MDGYQGEVGYLCGMGGVSSRVIPLPMACPGGFPDWWKRGERFWRDGLRWQEDRGWKRQPVPAEG